MIMEEKSGFHSEGGGGGGGTGILPLPKVKSLSPPIKIFFEVIVIIVSNNNTTNLKTRKFIE